MLKKISAAIILAVLAAAVILLLISPHKGNMEPETGTTTLVPESVKNEPIQFGAPETEDERPAYTASDYIECTNYQSIKTEAQGKYKQARETDQDTAQVSDYDVTEELYTRAREAGVSTDEPLGDEDAAIISGQLYQTMDEYKAYLAEVLLQKKEYEEKSDAFNEYIRSIIENSSTKGLPPGLEEYEEKYVEEHLEERAEMLGMTLDKIRGSGMYDTFKQTAIDQHREKLLTEMYIRYAAEAEGLVLEDGDIDRMFDFYIEIYGKYRAESMLESYSQAQKETEALYYKLLNTLF